MSWAYIHITALIALVVMTLAILKRGVDLELLPEFKPDALPQVFNSLRLMCGMCLCVCVCVCVLLRQGGLCYKGVCVQRTGTVAIVTGANSGLVAAVVLVSLAAIVVIEVIVVIIVVSSQHDY